MDNNNTTDHGNSKVHRLKQDSHSQTAMKKILCRLLEGILLCAMMLALLAILVRAVPAFERFLFPASARIESLKDREGALTKELGDLQKIVTQLKTKVTDFEKSAQQIAKNTQKITSLDVDVSDLKRKLIQVKIANGSEMSEKIQKIWNTILEKKSKGKAFSDDLGSMIPYVGTFKEMVDSIHGLSALATEPIATTESLITQLGEIKEDLLVQKGSEVEPTTWVGKFFRSIKNLVIVRKTCDTKPVVNSDSFKDLDQSVATIDVVLDLLKKNQLKDAVSSIRKTPIPGEKITAWISQLEMRINLDKSFKKMQKLMELMKS